MTEASERDCSPRSKLCEGRSIGLSSVAMRLSTVAILSLAILVTLKEATARAATIRDGDRFSISIESPGARTCIFFPSSLRDPTECTGLTLPMQPPSDSKRRDLAIGLIRFVEAGAAARASLLVTFVPEEAVSTETDQAAAETFAQGFEMSTIHMHPGAKIRDGTSHVEIRTVAGLKMVRMSYDMDGLNSNDRPLMEHLIGYFAWAEDGFYEVVLQTGGEHAASVDALADSSALTLRVSHPAQPAPPAISRPVLAVLIWLVFAVGVVINALWGLLRRDKPLATLPLPFHLTNRSTVVNADFDVSTPARLRKPLRTAAGWLKLIGLLSAVETARYLNHYSTPLILLCALAVLCVAFPVSKRLRAGSVVSARVASGYGVFLAGSVLVQLPEALRVPFTFHNIFYGSFWFFLSLIPVGLLARGLLAFRELQAYGKSPGTRGNPLASHPWEQGLYMSRRPKLANKRSIVARLFLLVSPIPYLWIWATPFTADKTDVRDFLQYGPLFESGYFVGSFITAAGITFGAIAWGSRIYRRARREALFSASEIIMADSRPIVLYLRSFQDDSGIRLRARATDGRILPERTVKISFEELITDHLWGYGPVLAIGNPGTKGQLAPLGAARDYPTDAGWRETAIDLMRQASMIVAIAGATQGLAWEIEVIVKQGLVSKLVLVLPPLGIEELTARWRFLLNRAIGPSLPSEIDFLRARAVLFPGGHSIFITGSKRNDWTYEAVLDAAALVIAYQQSTSIVGSPGC